MYHIKTLNSISDIIRRELTEDRYSISPEAENPDGILVRSANCHDMDFPSRLVAIARAGAGYNNIPVDVCTKRGIAVFNTPGANANGVKELALAAMLLSARNLVPAINWVNSLKGAGDVSALVEKGKGQFAGPELRGKKLGVIGLGSIGVMVANDAHAIGMDVYGYDPQISVESAWGLSRSVHRAINLESLLSECDFVTLHIPLTEQTRGFINGSSIAHMKPGAVLLNLARGEIVDTAAVIEAVESGRLGCYVTDFPTEELLERKNIICIPHLGASTPESEDNCARMAARQLREYIEYGNISNSVNLPSCEMPYTGAFRIALIHLNITNMVGQITAILAARKANIDNMINKSRGQIAYTLLDLDEKVNDGVTEELERINGMIRVRIIGNK